MIEVCISQAREELQHRGCSAGCGTCSSGGGIWEQVGVQLRHGSYWGAALPTAPLEHIKDLFCLEHFPCPAAERDRSSKHWGGSGVVQGQPSSWGGDGQEGLSPVCDSQVPSPHSGHSCSTPEHLLQLWGQCPAVTAAALSGLWALMGTHTQTPQCLTIAGPRMADKG